MMPGRKVLIVEDDPIIAEGYRRYVSKAGYQVEIARDGQRAMARLPDFRPDAVLLDLMLPHINGIEMLKKVRASEGFKSLPVIVLTSAFFGDMIKNAIAEDRATLA
jgi:DNA-binding response OmpR family regulator